MRAYTFNVDCTDSATKKESDISVLMNCLFPSRAVGVGNECEETPDGNSVHISM